MRVRKSFICLMTLVVVLSMSTSAFAAKVPKSSERKWGSAAMGGKTKVSWTIDTSKKTIIDSECVQSAGYFLPNYSVKDGKSLYKYGGKTHWRYTSSFVGGMGVIIAGVKVGMFKSFSDVGHMYNTGKITWK